MTIPPLNITFAQQLANTAVNNYSNQQKIEYANYKARYNDVFSNASDPTQTPPAPVSHAAVIAGLGTNAASVLNQLTAHYNFIQTISPSLLQTADAIPAYTVNSDNTVTLTA